MFASQIGDQRNLSGVKSYGNQVPESVQIMTLRMMSRINLSADKSQAQYEGIPLTYISVMGRIEEARVADQKGFFIINDDTGSKQFSIQFVSDIDRECFQVICNEEDQPKTYYYIFFIRVRINRDLLIYDTYAIKKVEVASLINHHLTYVMAQRCRIQKNQKKKHQQHGIIEEVPQKQNDLPMQEKILNFIKAEVSERGNIPINQQYIVNKFSDHFTIAEIKKSLVDLIQNGSLQQGQGVNTYILAD